MLRRLLLVISIPCLITPAFAQRTSRSATNTITSTTTSIGTQYYAGSNEPARAIEFKEKTVSSSAFLSNINSYLSIPAEFSFVEAQSNSDDLGMIHRQLVQHYKGIPLEGMNYRVHEKDGFVKSVNGRALRSIKLDTMTTINQQQAFRNALNFLRSKDTVMRAGGKVIVSKNFTFAPGSFVVAYQFEIAVTFLEQWRVSIDARTGQVVNKVSLVNSCSGEDPRPQPSATGTGLTAYYGSQTIRVESSGSGSRLVGQTEHGGLIGTYDFANVNVLSLLLFFEWSKAYDIYSSTNSYTDKPASSAQWAAEKAYEYYFTKHNRNSFDNKGSQIKSYVHVDKNMNNAFWVNGLLAFGDGSNNNPLVELDVVSHELTHGVTQYEANLNYYYEPGALNESFSDILGKAVEFATFGDTATWQLARHYRQGGLRDMSDPNLRNQPDTYSGDLWYTGYEDNGGVHTNSGVQNFWFYLLCKGGSGVNDKQFQYAVDAIGIDAATKIVYRNLTEYLDFQSDYLDSRIGSMLAAADLYGKNSTIYQQVDKAWDAVGVIDEPIINGLELYDITATTVKIKASLQPRADTATYHFEYGTTTAYGSSTPVYGYKDKVEGILRGLQSNTKYYVRLVATNVNGNSYYATEFTTLTLAPLVKIKETADVMETKATLYGQVNPNSLQTSFYFEYGQTTALGLVTQTYPLSDTTEFMNVGAPVINLQPRKTYYYRLVATNGFASSVSETTKFFSASRPVIDSFSPPTANVGAEVIITGKNFNSIADKNFVNFGAVRATILSCNTTQIKVAVPAGASFGPISLLDSETGLSSESVQEFTPTFTGEFKKNHLQMRVGTTDGCYQVLVQDMDGDNKPDIVSRHYLGFSVFVNAIAPGGEITAESFVRSTFNGNDTPGTFALIDFDGNGLKDFVTTTSKGIVIYPNYSVPGYIFFGDPIELPKLIGFRNFLFKDLDGDGRIDIAATEYVTEALSHFVVFRNENRVGSLSADNFRLAYSKPLPYYILFLTGADMNNDQMFDMMVSAYNKQLISILKNKSHPGIFDFEEITIPDVTSGYYARYDGHDLNKDGWKDLTSLSPYPEGTLVLFENQAISSPISLSNAILLSNGNKWTDLQPGDINGDGKVDLLASSGNRSFFYFLNKLSPGDHLTASSFEIVDEYGMRVTSYNEGRVSTEIIINDLNGDGRPDLVNRNSYSYGPHDGYNMEIWQNAPINCIDPALVKVSVSGSIATIVLPANTTIDQYEIDYYYYGNWYALGGTTLNVYTGNTYKLRVRAKCYLGFTNYSYLEFSTDCVDTNSVTVTNIGVNAATLQAYNLALFEIQYSPAGQNQWTAVGAGVAQLSNLLPGTKYDLRLRGRYCATLAAFSYKEFTTLCPKLSAINVTDLAFDRVKVAYTSAYPGDGIFEYSTDNTTWKPVSDTYIISSLVPTKTYFIRGRLKCTSINSDYLYTSFTKQCPKISMVQAEDVTPYTARITWVDESKTGSYTYMYKMKDEGPFTTAQTSSTSFTMKNLIPGTDYTVIVGVNCATGNENSTMTFRTICMSPTNLTVANIAHTEADLSWVEPIGGVPYYVDYSIQGSNRWQTVSTSAKNISLNHLRPGATYEARVHIRCTNETPAYAEVIFETELYGETTIGPNPSDGMITIYPGKDLIGNPFLIVDTSGKVLVNKILTDYTLDLSGINDGLYLLKIAGEKKVFRFTVIR